MTDELLKALVALREEVRSLEADCAPHAPEIPFYLRGAIEAVFEAASLEARIGDQ